MAGPPVPVPPVTAASFLPPAASSVEAPPEVTWPGVKRELGELATSAWDTMGEYSPGYNLSRGILGLQVIKSILPGESGGVQAPDADEIERQKEEWRRRARPLVTPIHESEPYREEYPAEEDENTTYSNPIPEEMPRLKGFGEDRPEPTFEDYIVRAVKPPGGNWVPEITEKGSHVIQDTVTKRRIGDLDEEAPNTFTISWDYVDPYDPNGPSKEAQSALEDLRISLDWGEEGRVSSGVNTSFYVRIGSWEDTPAERLHIIDRMLREIDKGEKVGIQPQYSFSLGNGEYDSIPEGSETGPGAVRELLQKQREWLLPQAKLQYWGDTTFAKYVRNHMGTATDPLLSMVDKEGTYLYDVTGKTHAYDPAGVAYGTYRSPGETIPPRSERESAGFAPEGEYPIPSDTPLGYAEAGLNRLLAHHLETQTDKAIRESTVGEHASSYPDLSSDKNLAWMEKVDQNSPIYSLDRQAMSEIGFDAMFHELQKGVMVNTNLPKRLRILPKHLERMSVPEAVTKAHKIREWRFKETERLLAEAAKKNLSTTPHLDIPEINMSWIAIPDVTSSPEAMCLAQNIGTDLKICTQQKSSASVYGSGKNRLFALIDKSTGKPYMQVEVEGKGTSENPEQAIGQAQIKSNITSWNSPDLESTIAKMPDYRDKMHHGLYKFILHGNTTEASEVARGRPFTRLGTSGIGGSTDLFDIEDRAETEARTTGATINEVLERWYIDGKIDSVDNYDPETRYVLRNKDQEQGYANGGLVAADFLPENVQQRQMGRHIPSASERVSLNEHIKNFGEAAQPALGRAKELFSPEAWKHELTSFPPIDLDNRELPEVDPGQLMAQIPLTGLATRAGQGILSLLKGTTVQEKIAALKTLPPGPRKEASREIAAILKEISVDHPDLAKHLQGQLGKAMNTPAPKNTAANVAKKLAKKKQASDSVSRKKLNAEEQAILHAQHMPEKAFKQRLNKLNAETHRIQTEGTTAQQDALLWDVLPGRRNATVALDKEHWALLLRENETKRAASKAYRAQAKQRKQKRQLRDEIKGKPQKKANGGLVRKNNLSAADFLPKGQYL